MVTRRKVAGMEVESLPGFLFWLVSARPVGEIRGWSPGDLLAWDDAYAGVRQDLYVIDDQVFEAVESGSRPRIDPPSSPRRSPGCRLPR
jgi:hypothetical protein